MSGLLLNSQSLTADQRKCSSLGIAITSHHILGDPYTRLLHRLLTTAATAPATAQAEQLTAASTPTTAASPVANPVSVESRPPPQTTVAPPNCTIVNDKASAMRVLEILTREDIRSRYHAADTETRDIDPKAQSPVGTGNVICVSIYVGPDVDFGTGSRVWIDNLDGAEGVLMYFKEYFEDESIKKVWHNYGFDRHVMYNHGINVKGFGGDTMQMARLWNSARTFDGGYSLEALSRELCGDVAPKVR